MELFHIDQQIISSFSEERIPKTGYLWLVIERSEAANINDWIIKMTGKSLNDRHLEDLKQPNHQSFYESMPDYDILIFRSVSEHKEEQRRFFNVTVSLSFEKLLISIYDKNNQTFSKIHQLFEEQKRTIPQSPQLLAEFCVNFLVDRFLDIKQNLDTRLTLWQKKLLQIKSQSVDWNALLAFKTDLRRVKVLCEEQVDVLNGWRSNMRLNSHHIDPKVQEQLIVNLNDVVDHANRGLKLATQLQQEFESLMQLHFTILSHRTNEIMRILALVTCIFLPPNLITGIFGMNFTYIPDLSKPHSFYFALLIMAGFSSILWVFFKWRKWI